MDEIGLGAVAAAKRKEVAAKDAKEKVVKLATLVEAWLTACRMSLTP